MGGLHDRGKCANQDGSEWQTLARLTKHRDRPAGTLAISSLCIAALNSGNSDLGSLSRFALPRPLPAVRLEVAQPAAWHELISALRTLGFAVQVGNDAPPSGPEVRVTDGSSPLCDSKLAFVFIAKARSVQTLTAAIEAGASGYFVVPIDFLSLSATICSAALQGRDLSTITEQSAKLYDSVAADQTINTVVGILMERYRFQRAEAYERLRRYSRTERRKVAEVATQIVIATEELSKTMREIESIAQDF